MAGMIGDPELEPNHHGDSAAGPHLAAEAIGFGPTLQALGQTGELPGREPARGSRNGPVAEGLPAAYMDALHPLADSRFADTQRLGDLALGPALWLELPGLEPSHFFPIGR
jgi:hypothetical protein